MQRSSTPARRATPKKSELPEWLTRTPEPFRTHTLRLLSQMGRLKKPAGRTDPDREELFERAEAVEQAWEGLQRTARAALGCGTSSTISVSDWRAAIWASSQYKNANAVWSSIRQSSEEYRRWKASYDRRRKCLRRLGLWEAAKAYGAARDILDALVEAQACPGDYSAHDKLRIIAAFEVALAAYQKQGQHFCGQCDSRIVQGLAFFRCLPVDAFLEERDTAYWLESSRRAARLKAAEGAYNDRPHHVPAVDDDGQDDPAVDEIDGVSLRYDHEQGLADDHHERQTMIANGYYPYDSDEDDFDLTG